MQQPVGAPEPPSVVPNAAQLSREAKHMRVMLMLCVKEKVFDQAALESIFSQWLLCEQQNEGHVEETDAAFRRSLGRTYGPRSKDFLGAIDRAKVKLEQLKERKSRGELGSGGSIGGVPPPNLPPSSIGNPQIGMPGQMGGQIGGQPLSNQPPAQMMSHQSLGQMPHLAQPQQPPPQPHLTQQHPPQQYPPQHTQQHPPHPHPSQHPSQQHPPQHPPQHIGQPTLGNLQYYKPHTQQTLQQQQQQHQPPLQQSHLGLGQQMPHIQNNVPQIIGIQSSTQPSYKMQNLPPQQMTGPQSHPLPHHNPPGPTIGMTQQTMMYENRPPSLMNPSSNNDNIRPLPNMNPVNPMQTVNNPPQEPYKPPSHTPIPVDHDDHKDDKKKAANKKKGIEEFDDPKKRKSGAGMTGDVKKQKSKGEIAEKEVPRMVGGLPLPDSRIAPMTTGNPDDLDNITEKPNLQQEGLQVLSNRQMTGYIIDGGMLTKEEYSSRQLMRDNVHPYDRHDHAVLEPLALEPWMERNIVGKEILDRGMQSLFNMKLEMTSESRRLLSDGIQSHLKTIVENALEISRKRLNRTACSSFYESFQQLKNHNGSISTEHHLSSVAIKWGPSLSSILSEEETKLKQFYKDYSDIDEEKLKEKMRQYDEERMKVAGAKRKAAGSGGSLIESEPQITWWDKDLSFEDEGILSYEKIAEVWKKNDIALKHELGQNSKRKSQKKGDNAPTEGNNDLKVGLRVNDSSIPMDTDELKNGEGEWKNQVCPIAIPSETHVTSDDLQFVISKMNNRNGGLIGSRSDREKIRKARFLRKPLTR